MKRINVPRAWLDPLVQPKHWKLALRFGTLNVRSLYRSFSLIRLTMELARYKLGLVGVQEVRWDKGGTVRAPGYNFLYGNGRENH
jgi:hypothetical protein